MTSEAGASQSAANDIQSAVADDIQSEAEVSFLSAAAAAAADESQPPAAQVHGSQLESDQIQLAADQIVMRVRRMRTSLRRMRHSLVQAHLITASKPFRQL